MTLSTGSLLSSAALRTAASLGPSYFPREHLDAMGTYGGTFPESAVLAPRIIDRLKRARRVGVKMAFGTDTVIDLPHRTRADLMLDYLAVWRSALIPPPATS